ncbi:MAG: glycoside hydrolase 100 family protein [Anaerolineaceae bacterium]|nr:glycoside hydrolase 100 family protein [Anaerolineaceae bacterium]
MLKNEGETSASIEAARQAALGVLLENAVGPFDGLPRTAGWGYPEPYTRDLMISSFGILASKDEHLVGALQKVLVALAEHQSPLGQIPSLAHDPAELGASDTTPLFLIGTALFRRYSGDADFLDQAVRKAFTWMEYQCPDYSMLVGQLPTSDWRDEHWVLGFGLYVNTLVYTYLRFYHRDQTALQVRRQIQHTDHRIKGMHRRLHEGLSVPNQPYYALWAYKVLNNERFDLLGNSLAILSGLASRERAGEILDWVEASCHQLHDQGMLGASLPPCLIPFAVPGDDDWHARMQRFNPPGSYHNGGIWPFIVGFYIVALVSAGRVETAQTKLEQLTELIRLSRRPGLAFGFNEWHQAQDGAPRGQDWQTWSAAMYLYAVESVRARHPLFFDRLNE